MRKIANDRVGIDTFSPSFSCWIRNCEFHSHLLAAHIELNEISPSLGRWGAHDAAERVVSWPTSRQPVVSVALKENGITARMKEMKPLFYTPAHSCTIPEAIRVLCIRRWRGRCSIKALLHIYKWIFGDSRILKCKVAYKLNTDSPTVHVCHVMGIIIFLC